MSMTPESPLFPAYQQPLELDGAAVEFNRRANAAFDALYAAEGLAGGKMADMIDTNEIRVGIEVGHVSEGSSIARSFERHPDGSSSRLGLRPAYEEFELDGRIVESRFGRVYGRPGAPDSVLRLVAMTKDASHIPDGRGYYVARSSHGTFTFFKIETDTFSKPATSRYAGAAATIRATERPSDLEEVASGGRHNLSFKATELNATERKAMLEELEKAAAILPGRRRR